MYLRYLLVTWPIHPVDACIVPRVSIIATKEHPVAQSVGINSVPQNSVYFSSRAPSSTSDSRVTNYINAFHPVHIPLRYDILVGVILSRLEIIILCRLKFLQ